jgi:peptide/nickel transport system ATP-binding protein
MLLLEINDLNMNFGAGAEALRTVDGVSLTIGAGETVCLVGESGCGMSLLKAKIVCFIDALPHCA